MLRVFNSIPFRNKLVVHLQELLRHQLRRRAQHREHPHLLQEPPLRLLLEVQRPLQRSHQHRELVGHPLRRMLQAEQVVQVGQRQVQDRSLVVPEVVLAVLADLLVVLLEPLQEQHLKVGLRKVLKRTSSGSKPKVVRAQRSPLPMPKTFRDSSMNWRELVIR